MNKIPLQLSLKREAHRNIAQAQDLIVEEVYKSFPHAVLHGGTAIWRCYSGKRFSEDLDFYLPRDEPRINALFVSLEKKGFVVLKKKVLERSVYSELLLDRTSVRLEATFQKISGVLCDYESSDGNTIVIYSLTPEDFVMEKVATYLKRRKIRDLWDIFFLIKAVNSFGKITSAIDQLLREYKAPIDEQDLKAIVLDGIVPSVAEMLDYIKRKWEKENTSTK